MDHELNSDNVSQETDGPPSNLKTSSALLVSSSHFGPSSLSDVNDIASLTSSRRGIVIESTGESPHFVLPQADLGNFVQCFIDLSLTAPVTTELQIFFLTEGKDSYSKSNSITYNIQQGYNRIIALIPADPAPTGTIRIQVGKAAGSYILHSLEIMVSQMSRIDTP